VGEARSRPVGNEATIHLSRRLGLGLALAPALLCGCLPNSIPSQSHPSCSWTSEPPANADSVCLSTFHTLRAVLNAAIRGDETTLSHLVPAPTVRRRIAVFGATVRHKGNISVHITPSFTLATVRNHNLGAEFNIVGKTHHGDVKAPQTVYLASRGGSNVIVQDQPMQEW
jgi:hypothetical protein